MCHEKTEAGSIMNLVVRSDACACQSAPLLGARRIKYSKSEIIALFFPSTVLGASHPAHSSAELFFFCTHPESNILRFGSLLRRNVLPHEPQCYQRVAH